MKDARRGLGPGTIAFVSVLSGSAAAAGINIATGHRAWAAIIGASLLVLLYAALEGWRAKRSPGAQQLPPAGPAFSSVPTPGLVPAFVPQPRKRSNRPMVAALAGYVVYLIALALVLIAATTHGNTSSGSGRAQVVVAADLVGAWSGLAHNVDETDSWAIRLVLPQGRHSGTFEYASFRCAGRITPTAQIGHQLTLELTIKENPEEGCEDGELRLSARRDGRLNVAIYREGGTQVAASSVLRKEPSSGRPRLPDEFGGTWVEGTMTLTLNPGTSGAAGIIDWSDYVHCGETNTVLTSAGHNKIVLLIYYSSCDGSGTYTLTRDGVSHADYVFEDPAGKRQRGRLHRVA
jgi:hypothetical protein